GSMSTARDGAILQYIRDLIEAEEIQALSDAEALRRFAACRDEQAFAVLLQRHARTVWAVCRRLLPEQDAEDAFQATFLVLARKAKTIRKSEAVGSWLYGVAHRVAVRARQCSRTRHVREQLASRAEGVPPTEPGWRELQSALDEEVQRLP